MDGWFLTYDQGEGKPAVFAYVDDLSQSEIDTLDEVLAEEIYGWGVAFKTYSTDYLLDNDRAMLIRFRREWERIEADLEDPTLTDGDYSVLPWYDYHQFFLGVRDEVISLREYDDLDSDDDDSDSDENLSESLDDDFASDDKLAPTGIDNTPQSILPAWDDETKILYWGTQVARRVSSNAKNVLAVLNAFQEDGWPARIDSPLPGGRNPERLRDTLKQLNKDLKHIRFSADGSGERIVWTKGEAGETTLSTEH